MKRLCLLILTFSVLKFFFFFFFFLFFLCRALRRAQQLEHYRTTKTKSFHVISSKLFPLVKFWKKNLKKFAWWPLHSNASNYKESFKEYLNQKLFGFFFQKSFLFLICENYIDFFFQFLDRWILKRFFCLTF